MINKIRNMMQQLTVPLTVLSSTKTDISLSLCKRKKNEQDFLIKKRIKQRFIKSFSS